MKYVSSLFTLTKLLLMPKTCLTMRSEVGGLAKKRKVKMKLGTEHDKNIRQEEMVA